VAEAWLAGIARSVKQWHQAALNNADGIKQSRMPPVWVPVTFILFHFVLIGLCVRYTATGLAVASILLYLCVLTAATVTLLWSCRHYQVSGKLWGSVPQTCVLIFNGR
jgi:hypothetical protein